MPRSCRSCWFAATCVSPNTSDPALKLREALHRQPLLVVLRADQPVELTAILERLERCGLRHVELAWSPHPDWIAQVGQLARQFPSLCLGAASVCTLVGVDAAANAGLSYVVSPILDAALLRRAQEQGLALVPGVMSPSEVHRARVLGCSLVKLFPAANLGPDYWRRLREPLGGLPACIAAGGLGLADVQPWLQAGVDAVALGGGLDPLVDGERLRALLAAITRRCTGPAGAADGQPEPGPPSPPPSAPPVAAHRGHGGP
jgi:2-dehydro-3-deoxyphosphogluconate aldolase/(4S)-4-hydroxy-2-oxoglutarate aldolase